MHAALAAIPAIVLSGSALAAPPPITSADALKGHLFPRGAAEIVLPNGEVVIAKRTTLVKGLCGEAPLTRAQAAQLLARAADLGPAQSEPTTQPRGSGFTIAFNPSGVLDANTTLGMQTTIDYYDSLFTDPTTITIDIEFDPGSFGGTGVEFFEFDYTTIRNTLIADADADDTIQNLLPVGSVPTRFSTTGSVSNLTAVTLTAANLRAIGINPGVLPDAFMFLTSEGDYDPADGLGNDGAGSRSEFSGVDILVHEVGHALGFVTLAEFGLADLSTLDLFRFREGSTDNPGTQAEFTTTPRTIDLFNPNNEHVFDIVVREHPLSNGVDFQASHFRETNFGDPDAPRVGVMEPAITSFETRFPDYFSIADRDAFDAIGYDFVEGAPCPADINNDGDATPADFTAWLAIFNNQATATPGELDRADVNNDGFVTAADFTAWLAAFNDGCDTD